MTLAAFTLINLALRNPPVPPPRPEYSKAVRLTHPAPCLLVRYYGGRTFFFYFLYLLRFEGVVYTDGKMPPPTN